MEPYTPERVSEINAAREANVSAGLPATSGAGATPLSISSQTLAATKPVEIPTPQPQISPVVALAAKAQAGQDAYKQAEEQVAKANQGVDNIQQKKQGILDYLGLGEKKAQGFYTEAQNALTTQVDPAQKELNDIRSKESDVLVQYRADTDAIKARGDISAEAQQGLQFNADDKYGRVLADLAIRKAAQIQNVTDLRQAIKDKLEMQLKPIDREQTFYKDFLMKNFDDLKQDEKDRINQIISERDKIKKEITDKENIAQSAYETAIKNGIKIPDVVVQEIQENPGQAYEILARNGVSLQNPLDVAYKQAQIDKLNSEIATTGGVSTGSIAQSLGITEEQFNQLPGDTKNTATLTAVLSSSKLGQGTKTQMANVLGVIKAAEDMAKAGQTEGFGGTSPFNRLLNAKVPFTDIGIPFRETLKSKSGVENEGYINAINLKVQQWASGASLTAKQTEQVEKFTPSVNDTDEKIRTKLNNLANFMYTQASAQLMSEGVDYAPEKVNLFETYDLIKKATPEQKAELRAAGLIK